MHSSLSLSFPPQSTDIIIKAQSSCLNIVPNKLSESPFPLFLTGDIHLRRSTRLGRSLLAASSWLFAAMAAMMAEPPLTLSPLTVTWFRVYGLGQQSFTRPTHNNLRILMKRRGNTLCHVCLGRRERAARRQGGTNTERDLVAIDSRPLWAHVQVHCGHDYSRQRISTLRPDGFPTAVNSRTNHIVKKPKKPRGSKEVKLKTNPRIGRTFDVRWGLVFYSLDIKKTKPHIEVNRVCGCIRSVRCSGCGRCLRCALKHVPCRWCRWFLLCMRCHKYKCRGY